MTINQKSRRGPMSYEWRQLVSPDTLEGQNWATAGWSVDDDFTAQVEPQHRLGVVELSRK